MRALAVLLLAGCPSKPPVAPHVDPATLVTTGEASGYTRTGRYDEAVKLCDDFAHAFPGVSCERVGRTAEDRPIVAVVIAKRPNLPVIYIQAGIHAGEIEGKDAGFAFLRDLLLGKIAPGALDAVSVVFVPVLNPDGHERFGPNNRPNQRGPIEMGFRTNGTRLNINRDFVKADTEEARAVLGIMKSRDPVLLVDLHTTDGAKFEHDISLNVAPIATRPDQLEETAATFVGGVMKRMTELGHLPVDFYPSFIDDEDPLSGFETGEAPARFSQMYAAARGRIGLLVETHSWRTYKERVGSTYHALQSIFEQATTNAPKWRQVCDEASRADAALGGQQVTILWKATAKRAIEFRGYAFDKRDSEISGGKWLVYDETKPQIWRVPLMGTLAPAVAVTAPRSGYIVDGGVAKQVADVLDRHGLVHTPIAGRPKLAVETFRATKVSYQPPFEGRTRAQIEGAWQAETRTLDQGAMFVPIAQPHARLVLHLLDPALPDSFAQWGFFNAAFEQKEYMEPYVAEQVARELLAKDPTLQAKFDAAVAADPELAKSPGKRLQWFYKLSPAWDERVNLLPVYKIDRMP